MSIAEPKLKEVRVAYEQYEGRHLKIVYRDMALHEPTSADGAWYARDIEAYVDGLVEREGWAIKEVHIIGRRDAAAALGDKTEQVLALVFVLIK